MQTEFTVGIEEEFQVIDPETRDLRSSFTEILESGKEILQEQIKQEIFQAMVEVGTVICHDVDEARREVIHLRRTVGDLAESAGGRVVASGTHPFAAWQDLELTPDDRYITLTEQLQEIARSIAVYGLHVHVGVDDRDQAIEIMNEARYFLPHILALSVNSPFWEGRDTGIKSYRSVIWGRMPRSGIPDQFASWDDYRRFVDTLIRTQSIDEPKKIWWDIRPHPKFNTLEFRVCDMPTRVDETVAFAALFQAVVAKLAKLRVNNLGFRIYQRALIAENRWRAMRYGIDGNLIDFGKEQEVPMRQLAHELLEFVDDVVDDLGSRSALRAVEMILKEGTGADRQQRIFEQCGDLKAVVDFLAEETMHGVREPAGSVEG
ncbi:MAG TPA: carboxylate-amine ligase [Chloroflexota bacterium]|nr:carboxylate-amine ligase [Chloroflexota bacterium]